MIPTATPSYLDEIGDLNPFGGCGTYCNPAGQPTSVQNAGRFTAVLGFRGPGQDELVQDGAQTLQQNALGIGARTNTAASSDSGAVGIQSSCGGHSAAERTTAMAAAYHYARSIMGPCSPNAGRPVGATTSTTPKAPSWG